MADISFLSGHGGDRDFFDMPAPDLAGVGHTSATADATVDRVATSSLMTSRGRILDSSYLQGRVQPLSDYRLVQANAIVYPVGDLFGIAEQAASLAYTTGIVHREQVAPAVSGAQVFEYASVLTGVGTLYNASKQLQAAQLSDNVWHKTQPILRLARGSAEIASGALSGTKATLDCLGTSGMMSAAKAHRIGLSLGAAASVGGIASSMAIFTWATTDAARTYSTLTELKETMHEEGATKKDKVANTIQTLKNKLKVSKEEIREIVREVSLNPDVFIKRFGDEPTLTRDDLALLGLREQKALEEQFSKYSFFNDKAKLYAISEVVRQRKTKQVDLAMRLGDPTLVDLILTEEQKPLVDRLETKMIGDPYLVGKTFDHIERVMNKAHNSMVFNSFVATVAVLWIVSSIFSDFFTAGVMGLVTQVLSFAVSILWLVVDGKAALDIMWNDETLLLDKVLKALTVILTVAAIVTATVLSGGIAPAAVALTIGVLILIVNLAILIRSGAFKEILPVGLAKTGHLPEPTYGSPGEVDMHM